MKTGTASRSVGGNRVVRVMVIWLLQKQSVSFHRYLRKSGKQTFYVWSCVGFFFTIGICCFNRARTGRAGILQNWIVPMESLNNSFSVCSGLSMHFSCLHHPEHSLAIWRLWKHVSTNTCKAILPLYLHIWLVQEVNGTFVFYKWSNQSKSSLPLYSLTYEVWVP